MSLDLERITLAMGCQEDVQYDQHPSPAELPSDVVAGLTALAMLSYVMFPIGPGHNSSEVTSDKKAE